MEYFEEGRQFTSKREIQTTINKILKNSKEVCLTNGTIIYTAGDKADYGYFLVEGSVAFLSIIS